MTCPPLKALISILRVYTIIKRLYIIIVELFISWTIRNIVIKIYKKQYITRKNKAKNIKKKEYIIVKIRYKVKK